VIRSITTKLKILTDNILMADYRTPVTIYVDGGYDKYKNNASWAFAVIEDNKVVFENKGIIKNPLSRNIDGECNAVIEAVKWFILNKDKNSQFCRIMHDYIGLGCWACGKWKADREIAKKYTEFITRYTQFTDFIKVKAHNNDKWNTYVDKLTKEAYKM
jgi:ribonuclease HI